MGIPKMSASAKPVIVAAVVTKAELLELADWEKKNSEAKKAASDAERNVNARRLALAEKVLGLTLDELKHLGPDDTQRLFLLRLNKHLWTVQRGAPMFTFEKYSEGRYPAWKSLFVAVAGEGRAAQVQIETQATYSYRVKVELP
jgi:hypothetical protein